MQILNDILVVASLNFTNFSTDFLNWSVTPYTNYFGNYFWLLIFAAVIGFTYVSTGNLGSTIAVIFVTFAVFGTTNVFVNEPEYSLFFSIIAIAGLAGIILTLFIKRRM